ncbi:PREDICTED: putative leucine-rich repeat-containing protein DDB_G0290503 [Habropoda laboriosa]|uniref:putative leucine-rich repeat-containing protein DDB_G0290503 n=1 Tax=Habropoda laboriosa TaxID=597456 RepID=UPI00083CB34A|nr:PREDICTED: putative leucine-rich repeat-containing protein DDB_G0290503 [Habropoda laboriosa]
MSFSKARIQRFNEFENDVPPPGSYDPRFDSKVRGLVIEKSERFHDNKSAGSAECNLSVYTKSTGNIVASFRTPQLPRKKDRDHTSKSCTKVKLRALISVNDQKLKYDSKYQIADLQVECSNKDRTIEEQEKHIENMKVEVRKLELQIEELRKKQAEVEDQHRKDIETMAKLQQEVLNGHDEKHQAEIEHLRCHLLEVSEEKEREIEARRIMEGDLRSRITDFSKRVTALESELANKKYKNVENIQSLETEIEELVTKLERVKEDYKHEVNLLDEEKSKLNLCIINITDERDKLEVKLQKRQNVILELQAQLSALQCELDELKAEYEKLLEDYSIQMDDVRYKHQEEINKLTTDFEKEKVTLRNENDFEISRKLEIETKAKDVEEENNFLKEELEDIQRLYKDVNNRLYEAHQELEESDRKHNLVLKKQKEDLADIIKLHDDETFKLKQQLENARLDYLKEIENLSMARDKEIVELKEVAAKKVEEETKRIKQHAEKMVENAEAVTRETLAACRTECEERVKRVIAESDAKVNAMIREARATVEEEMRLSAERYKACLARVELERAALDEKLVQKNAEITRLSVILEDLKSSAETQESFGQSLQMELDRAETELAEKKEELRALKDQIRTEAAEMVARKKRFEVIMAENQASVAALSKRLAQSNAEVERLQHALKRGEDCINEHRDLLSIMRNNSQMVHEQVHALMEQLDAKKGLFDQIEADSIKEAESIKSIFEAKIDDLKQITTRQVAKLQADYDAKTSQNAEMKNQLHEMANHLAEAQNMLLKLEERNDIQELEISRIELLNDKLNVQLKEYEATVEDNKKLLEEQSKTHKIVLNEANSKIQELCEKIKCLEEDDNRIQENVELFEEERNERESFEKAIMEELEEEKARREAAEEEVKKLTEHNERLKKDYQEISEKYAEVVGHHNHRQRIKHVSQLKDKINQLEQDLHGKIRTIEQQQKVIEKLRAEEKRAHSKGKENMIGIPKSSHTTPASSPHKPLTPLRNRND